MSRLLFRVSPDISSLVVDGPAKSRGVHFRTFGIVKVKTTSYNRMPSFSIEVAGEANPLTEKLLVHSLTSAASTNPSQIQTGTKQLQQWEKSPGYYKHLQSAYLDQRLPIEIRYLAIIQLKNGIDKYWRKTALKYALTPSFRSGRSTRPFPSFVS